MTYPLPPPIGEPVGHTYGGVFVRGDALAALREVRFTGWVAPPEGGWQVAVAAAGAGAVAAGRRGVVGLGGWLAGRLGVPVLAVRVVDDRQLLLAGWDPAEVGTYVSDPSYGRDDDTLPDPLGARHAAGYAALAGRPAVAEELRALLAEELDPDSVIESERLVGVLRLLGLPEWVVAAPSLPGDVPTGPRAADLTRLGAGTPGLPGRLRGRAARVRRRRRRPPDPVPAAPQAPDIDPWLL
jgi:hypothetical protein